ncbi:MAG: putative DNA binding domain-containing protein [Bacteroidaceae bacterium]|nr:putative DNA binding domain-containing protein [Bacteroidaceae bacterium]MCF0220884.1 putative DNA binding domain-containing protein [Fibrobacter sp.]
MNKAELLELCQCGETSRVQFKQEFTTHAKIAQEIVAFANSHGGVILFGIEDKTGELIGLTYQQLQATSLELGNTANEQVKPAIYIETEVVKANDKLCLVCHVEEGRNKPYKTSSGEIWVKQGADKRRVTENSEILSLFQDSGNYHAEEQGVLGTSIGDLEMAYLRNYYQMVYGKAVEDFNQPLEGMLKSIGVMAPNGELTRAGLLYFGKFPQQYEHSFKIKAVAFVGNSIGGKEYIDSRDIVGTLPMMFREGMTFLRSILRHTQNEQSFNSIGVLEIPEIVLEELLQNALVHIDLLHPAAIRLLVFENRIEIINPGRLYGGLKVEDIMLGASKQRNPLMATFAERTMIYRGLGSGIVRAMRENVVLDFINEEETNQFRAIIWRTTQKDEIATQKAEFTTQKRVEEADPTTQKELSTTQKAVLDYFRNYPKGTREDAAKAIPELTEDGVKYIIGRLQQMGLLKREGGRKSGYWVTSLP